MDPGSHVLQVDVHQPGRPEMNIMGDRQLALTVQVADVQRQPQPGRVDSTQELLETEHRVDQHSRLGLEPQNDAPLVRIVQQLRQARRPATSSPRQTRCPREDGRTRAKRNRCPGRPHNRPHIRKTPAALRDRRATGRRASARVCVVDPRDTGRPSRSPTASGASSKRRGEAIELARAGPSTAGRARAGRS